MLYMFKNMNNYLNSHSLFMLIMSPNFELCLHFMLFIHVKNTGSWPQLSNQVTVTVQKG